MNTARVAPENVNIDTLPYFFQSVITMAMNSMKKSNVVYGVATNDANYSVSQAIRKDGKYKVVWTCNFYTSWKNMLQRCYSESFQSRRPTYKGCSVVNEWLHFSNFKSWMENQEWRGNSLDKDILIPNNKIYAPDRCVFVPKVVNNFVEDGAAGRGQFMIGVTWDKAVSKYKSQCCNPFTRKQENLGLFTDELLAHLAWKKRKHELACQLADTCDNPRLAEALRQRYAS